MKKNFYKTLLLVALGNTFANTALAQDVPKLINYQGRLTGASGNPVTDGNNYEIEVRLWATSNGGATPTWAASYPSTTVKNGALNLILGSDSGVPLSGFNTSLPQTAFSGNPVFIGLTVTKGADGTPIANPSEILPRQQWLTVPFAFRAQSVASGGVDSAAIQDGAITKADLAIALQNELNQLVPTGTVVAFAGNTPPLGWLLCDGSLISRIENPSLFSTIGTAHGSGDNTTNFNLPDYRGRFLRGLNGSASEGDPDASTRLAMKPGGNTGNTIGSVQNDEFKSHTHDAKYSGTGSGFGSGPHIALIYRTDDSINAGRLPSIEKGGAETRPKNAYVNYIIKK